MAAHALALEADTLAEALAKGDLGAFGVFVDQQATPVLRICYRILGRLEEAEDAAQEAFVLAYRGLSSFRGEGSPEAWMARIATRQCWRRRSRGARRMAVTIPLDDAIAASLIDPTDPARDVLTAERTEAVRLAVGKLPEPYREVVVLRYFAELSVADIAAATKRPEGTVKAQLHRGLERLRLRLWEAST